MESFEAPKTNRLTKSFRSKPEQIKKNIFATASKQINIIVRKHVGAKPEQINKIICLAAGNTQPEQINKIIYPSIDDP